MSTPRFWGLGLAVLAALAFLTAAPAADEEAIKGKIKIAGHSVKMKADTLYLISARGKGVQPVVVVRPEAGGDLPSFSFGRDAFSFLPPRNGTYQLLVFPQISATLEEGDYDYTMKILPVTLAAKPLVEEANKLTDTDPPYPPRNTPFKAYTIQLKANQYYIIDLERQGQDRIDPFLYLENPQGKVVANDDDGGEGTNARLVYRAEADGEYRIIATTLFKGAGGFHLRVRTEKK